MRINVDKCELFCYFHSRQFNLVCLILNFRIGMLRSKFWLLYILVNNPPS